MTANAQMPSRKQFRLSRIKSNEVFRPKQQQIVRPTGGSKQTQPFDPLELSRRLENYQQDQRLAKARRETLSKAQEATSPQDRNDSGLDDKTETISLEDEDKVVVQAEIDPELQSTQQSSRPRADRKVSTSRARRNTPGTYFPRFAAKQFSSTTTPLPPKPAVQVKEEEQRRKAISDASNVPGPKRTYDDGASIPRPAERTAASAPDLHVSRDRRRSAAVLPEMKPSSMSSPRTTRPRPLSTALEAMNFLDDDDKNETNPYMPSSSHRQQEQTNLRNFIDAANERQVVEHRPALLPSDRHDWSQASQSGDSARHSIHLHNIWRKDQAPESKQPHRGSKLRGKSQGDTLQNQTMIADAVKLVEKERKSSFLAFLKRHHH